MRPRSLRLSKRRALDLIAEVLALEGAERRAFIDQICADDAELRREIERLLAPSSSTLDQFFEPAALDPGRQPISTDAPTLPLGTFESTMSTMPEHLGPYRVIECLGRGGMGTVYLAEQERPVQRRVALKVINSFSNQHQAERFALECQALARLSHPHIASLFEVGATKEDQPYVAMELIEGTTITEWCDQHRLSLRQRIELFMGVCAGVRHAHEKGILHRDLKPSNILVTEVDGQPTAKVIDFGIARAVDNPLFDNEKRLTLADQIVGSPIYMSPETILGERDTDTRSDVHALGLILYELVVGVLPFDPEKDTLAVLLHQIATTDMPGLSWRFAGLDQDVRRRICERRNLSEQAFRRQLQGDLGAIAGKALARDRDARYGSPADLATDLRYVLEQRPVSARPARSSYLLTRYLQRHLGFVVAISALMLTLVAGIFASTREARRANLEATRAILAVEQSRKEARRARLAQAEAQEVSSFLVGLFEIVDPERDPEKPVDARQLFDRGVEKLRTELHDQPLARARLLSTVCDIYTKMALFDQAEELALEALELRQARLDETHDDLLRSINQLGVIYRRQGRFDEAEPLLRSVVRARRAVSPPDPQALAQALNNLGNLFWNQNRLEEASETHLRALEIRESIPDLSPQILGESLNNLGVLFRALKRDEEAEVYLQRADTIFLESLGPRHPIRAAGLNNLGMVEHRLRKWQRAETHLREAVSIWKMSYGDRHPRTMNARINLSRLMITMGRDAESVEVLRALLADQQALSPPTSTAVAATLRSLGLALGRLGDPEAAQTALKRSLDLYSAVHDEQHRLVIRGRSHLAWLDIRRGRFAEAATQHRQLLDIRRRTSGEDQLSTASSTRFLALALLGQGRDEEAEPLLRRALEIRETRLGPTHDDIAEVLLDLGELLARTGRQAEARPLLRRADSIYAEWLPPEHREARRARAAIAESELAD